ncbi:hypothetical protein ACSLPB_29645, partial [Escherichia coli]
FMLVSGLVFLPRRPVFPALFRTALTKLVSIVSDVYVNVAYVIYLVTSERHAFLLDYWDEPAHKTVEIDEQKQKLVVECDRI